MACSIDQIRFTAIPGYKDLGLAEKYVTSEDFIKKQLIKKSIDKVLAAHNLELQGSPNYDSAPCVDAIKAWLTQQNIVNERDKIIKEIKDDVFEAIEAKDIEEDYLHVLNAIIAKLKETIAANDLEAA